MPNPIDHNPILKKLGFDANDRVVVIHADDVGMCNTTLDSFAELHDFGIVSSGSVMVPCPAFQATADWASNNPKADLGVHLTLTSEWETYRWGPVTEKSKESGMIDDDGYLHKNCKPLWSYANLDDVYDELQGQVNMALDAGMNVSHLDSHMFCCKAAHFFPTYLRLGQENNLTNYLSRDSWERIDTEGHNVQLIADAEENDHPVFDHLLISRLGTQIDNLLDFSKNIIDSLNSGLTYYIIHPARGTEEMKSITPDWFARDAEYQIFKNSRLKKHIEESGVHVISFEDINRAK